MPALLAALTAVTLAACGSSSTNTTTASTEAAVTAATSESEAAARSASEAAAQAAIPTPGCNHVAPPPSRAGEEVPKPTTTLDPAHSYTVTLQTNCGPIVISLAVKEAPKIASTFAYLVSKGYYNQLTFHRIVPGFVIQGGDPNGNGSGGPSWQVVEKPPSNLKYTEGTVAMAKSSSAPPGAAGSQFFIVNTADAGLPPEYALIGHVVAGQNNVQAISRVRTEASRPLVPIVIEKASLTVH